MRWPPRSSRTWICRCSASTRRCAIWTRRVFKANYTPTFTTTHRPGRPDAAAVEPAVGQHQPADQRPSTPSTSASSSRRRGTAGSYQVLFNNGRTTTNNVFTSFDPQLTSNISATYTQPLLRNFKIDGTRQQLLVSQKNREISDTQLQQSIAQTVRNVRNAYYDLMYAIGNLNVQRQSLRAVAAVAQGQPRPRRDRHHGAARHRPGRGRSGDARGSGDRRRGGDRAAAGSAPRAGLQTRRRRNSGPRASSRPKPSSFAPTTVDIDARGEERAQPAHRPRGGAQEPRVERRLDPLLRQPVDAGPERVGQLRRPGHRRRRTRCAARRRADPGPDHRPGRDAATGARSAQVFGGDFPGVDVLARPDLSDRPVDATRRSWRAPGCSTSQAASARSRASS